MARLILTSWLDAAARRFRWLRTVLFGVEAAAIYACWYAFRLFSPERSSQIGRVIVGALGPRSAKADMQKANLQLAFPDASRQEIDAIAARFWRNLGAVFGEYPHLETIALADGGRRLELVDRCGLERYRQRERRGVFFSAHLSNWELMALALARAGVPLLALYARLQNEALGELMDRARRQLGCELIAREASMKPILRHLGAGGSLGILVDLKVDEGIEVPFFGRPMCCSPVPARMAERFDCDLVPIAIERLAPASYRVTVLPPLPAAHRDAVSSKRDAADALVERTRAMNETIEGFVRARPDEWLATNRRWPKSAYPLSLLMSTRNARKKEQ